ncbi:MAG: energy-coupling factor transporter transmembrane protein EcfT [Chloroflexota bacterium]|nr:energy-coupling factor transporter transmembrane protein EcfT [Chloroflexota bacterium]
MNLFTPLRPAPSAPLARANPVAKLGAAAILMTALFLSADPITPGIVVLALLAAVPFTGLKSRDLLARSWPLLLAALAVGILNTVFAPERPAAESLVSGVGLGLRLLGIAMAGLLALATTDPTDLADALQQQLHLSPRVAIGTLAAVRLLPIMASEWQALALARRARGVDAGHSPLAAVRIAFGMLLALLVGAVRRGTRLAMAMEARGFGALPCRSIARPQRMHGRDWQLIAVALLVAGGAVAISLAAGSWRFVFG